MTAKERWNARRKLKAAGLPIPANLTAKVQGRKKEIPQFKPGLNVQDLYRARRRFREMGLPVPAWCEAKTASYVTVPRNKGGMSYAEYLSVPWPVWAKFKAVDQSGDAWFHEVKPRPIRDAWSSKGRISFLGEVVCGKKLWYNTEVVK